MLIRDSLTLWSASEVVTDRSLPDYKRQALVEIARWSQDFLVSGHPDLGRTGPVCPFSKPSMNRGLSFLAYDEVGSDHGETVKTILLYRDWHAEIAAELSEKERQFLTVVILLPSFDHEDPTELNDLQAQLKDEFVTQGLMIGQFHPHCEEPGLWNQNFRPLQAPLPLLAIRYMVPSDLPFLVGKARHVDAYLARFAAGIPVRVRTQLTELIVRPPARQPLLKSA
jgi:hypothetical protein